MCSESLSKFHMFLSLCFLNPVAVSVVMEILLSNAQLNYVPLSNLFWLPVS